VEETLQKITPFLWFDDQAEEAANFYVSAFSFPGVSGDGSSKILSVARYGESGPGEAGTVMVVSFLLKGQEFRALNGAAVPLHGGHLARGRLRDAGRGRRAVGKLSEGGKESACGWLKDRYGLSWQIVPTVLNEMLEDPDPERSQRVMKAMLQMGKIDIAELRRAYDAA
jgi:predicted 3-demethylubiquinone-9 3-methyltransferase (glyoxalase superfamily)